MSYKLVVTEKPSVAQAIAKVLGAKVRRDGYFEGCGSPVATSKCQRHLEAPTESTDETGYLVSWCVGHLVEPAEPDAYDVRYKKWKKEDLPIVPAEWKYNVSTSTQKQFNVLKRLMTRSDVSSLVCATDAGREGELIFRHVYNQCGCDKPFERLWISSMEDSAIREGFENLKPGSEYDRLYEAALCRERADWIVGMNATRLFSVLYGRTLHVGRVVSPTLAMTVLREAEISAFQPKTFYSVNLSLPDMNAASDRIKEKADANRISKECAGGMAVVTKCERKEKSEKAPALYDLTSLQRDANRLLGFTAQQTLDYLQSLYEKKLTSYPRTDSRYLTDDISEKVPLLVDIAAKLTGKTPPDVLNVSAVIDSKKVSDHHAIVPTISAKMVDLPSLPAGEREILRLIATRLLASVAPAYRYAETVAEFKCGDEAFTAKGKTVLDVGWKAIEKPGKSEKKEISLPEMSVGDSFPVLSATVKEGQTKPKAHFTEDTLLNAMERAGADSMPEDAERRGIGTPATRAGIIERLVTRGFLERNKEVQIYNYVTEGTFDAYLYQTLENKQKFISQIMTSKSPVRSCDDVDEQVLSYAEIKALCAGNPLIKEKMDLDIDVARLKVLKSDFRSKQYRLEDQLLKYFPREIEQQRCNIAGLKNDIVLAEAHPQPKEGFAGMTIAGKDYADKVDAGAEILAVCKTANAVQGYPLGSYRGFNMELAFVTVGESKNQSFVINLKGSMTHVVPLGTDPRGNIIRLDNAIAGIPARLEQEEDKLKNLLQQQEAAQVEVTKPFPQEAELAEKSARLAELDAALNMEDGSTVEKADSLDEENKDTAGSERPSVLADLKQKAEQIPPPRKDSPPHEEVL